ncbi:MAG: 4'-phosphopantetheinyl transferase superfamily protein [Ruminococcaceae bacterium]|nr:4'-phosphopantetheinyl transferase superfamily protein [Oscillospiraceae bacterium]
MVELYGVRLSMLPDRHAMIAGLRQDLYDTWRAKHKNVRDERTARSSLIALYLLDFYAPGQKLAYDANGRPYFLDSAIDFNITHTGNMTFLAIAREEKTGDLPFPRVGLDAEDLSRIATVRICPMAARWFSKGEYDCFLSNPSDTTFLRFWTRKESLIKWTGHGLRSLREADTLQAGERYGVSFHEYREENALITLCLPIGAIPPEQIHMLSEEELSAMGLSADTPS